jgi:hypothetical protein
MELIDGIDPIPAGLIETLEAGGIIVSRTLDGWLVSDSAAAEDIIATYQGSPAQTAFLNAQTNASLQAQIDALEALQTLRRMRDALASSQGATWLANLEAQVAALRTLMVR